MQFEAFLDPINPIFAHTAMLLIANLYGLPRIIRLPSFSQYII